MKSTTSRAGNMSATALRMGSAHAVVAFIVDGAPRESGIIK